MCRLLSIISLENYDRISVTSRKHSTFAIVYHKLRNKTATKSPEANNDLLHFSPVVYGALSGIEIHSYLYQLARICCIGLGIAFFLDLHQGFLCTLVTLELKYIHVGIRLHYAVGSSLGGVDLCSNILS